MKDIESARDSKTMQQVPGTKETLHAKPGVVLIVGLASYKGDTKVFQAFGYFSETFQISQECGLASAGCGRGPHFVFACADLSKI